MTDKQRSFFLELSTGLLILLFVSTATDKLLHQESFEMALHMSPLLHPFASITAGAVPVIELVLALLLFFPRWRNTGYAGSAFLLTCFSCYIVYMLLVTK